MPSEAETSSSLDRATRSSNTANQNRAHASMVATVTSANSTVPLTSASSVGESSTSACASPAFHFQFTLDADSPCEIVVYYFAREEVSNGELRCETLGFLNK